MTRSSKLRAALFVSTSAFMSIAIAQDTPEARFRTCWRNAGRDGTASARCIVDAPPQIRSTSGFGCLQAIAFARSAWLPAAQTAYQMCERSYLSENHSVPPDLTRDYVRERDERRAAAGGVISLPVIDTGGAGGGGVIIVPPSGGGHVRGNCRDRQACTEAFAMLETRISGYAVDEDRLRTLFATVGPSITFSCDTESICETYEQAVSEITTQGSVSDASVAQITSERALLDQFRCSSPTSCGVFDQLRDGRTVPSRTLNRLFSEGELRCVGDACTDAHAIPPELLQRRPRLVTPDRIPPTPP